MHVFNLNTDLKNLYSNTLLEDKRSGLTCHIGSIGVAARDDATGYLDFICTRAVLSITVLFFPCPIGNKCTLWAI